ncbi:hypothetical protein NHQ30_009908 [Ciborinia camelliae]|nr:hypothetical protein NHQ30_009908 [Ciborinia camelliae]
MDSPINNEDSSKIQNDGDFGIPPGIIYLSGWRYGAVGMAIVMSMFLIYLPLIVSGVAQNSTTLIVGRAVTGLGVAGTFSGSYIMGSAYAVTSVIGPLIGGALTDRVSFYINLPYGALTAASILFFFRVQDAVKPAQASLKEKLLQMDIPGFLFITASIVCYILALQWGSALKSWSNSDVVGTLVDFVLFLAVFAIIEWYQGERALLLRSIFRNPTIEKGCAFCFFLCRRDRRHQSIPDRRGNTHNHFLRVIDDPNSSSSVWIGYQSLAGIGLGLCFNVYIIAVQNIVKPDEIPRATSMLWCVSEIQTTFSPTELPGIVAAYMRGIHMAFALSIAMSGATTLVALSQGSFRMKKGDEQTAERDIEMDQQAVNSSQKS